ncbi:MAG: sulfite exporter TauE/SafE family protein [Anaerolineae bacterium]|nr:sulfite exporter TauE/SafE family protein [Anaerolineae bacterium]
MVVGFLAQLIDGALGMAYGVSSTTFLLSTGVSPAAASASVHTAEVFTTLASGASHLRLGNVDRRIFTRLVIPGMLGGITGAYILSNIPSDTIKPLVSIYLLLMGARILVKALRASPQAREAIQHLFPLGLVGGFFDAIGGGGWGPIVTTTLVARGNDPRTTIGSVNTAEFFVTFAEVATFLLAFSFVEYRTVIAGLVIGGVLAAPFAALVCRKLSARKLMVIVGTLIILLSLRTILQTL